VEEIFQVRIPKIRISTDSGKKPTLEVRDALNFLEPHTKPPWLILQYRNALDSDWTTDVGREGQQQVLRATFPGIRSSVKELLGKQIDALARRFAVSHDTRVGEEIERATEYGKLGEPWVFVERPGSRLTSAQ